MQTPDVAVHKKSLGRSAPSNEIAVGRMRLSRCAPSSQRAFLPIQNNIETQYLSWSPHADAPRQRHGLPAPAWQAAVNQHAAFEAFLTAVDSFYYFVFFCEGKAAKNKCFWRLGSFFMNEIHQKAYRCMLARKFRLINGQSWCLLITFRKVKIFVFDGVDV